MNRTILFLLATSLTLVITFTISCSSSNDGDSGPIGICTFNLGTQGSYCEEYHKGASAKDLSDACKEGYEDFGIKGVWKDNSTCPAPNTTSGELKCPVNEYGIEGFVYAYGAFVQNFDSCSDFVYYVTQILE